MKASKFVVAGGLVAAAAGVFGNFVVVENATANGASYGETGMQKAGAVLLALLAPPALAVAIALFLRFGRLLAGFAALGALLPAGLAIMLVKRASEWPTWMSIGTGLWLYLGGSLIASIAAVVALVRPERARAASPEIGAASTA
jgi:hypothetical protein